MIGQNKNDKVLATRGNKLESNHNPDDDYFVDLTWVIEHMYDKTLDLEDIPRLALPPEESYDNYDKDSAMHNCVCFPYIRANDEKQTIFALTTFCINCARMMTSADCIEHKHNERKREIYNLTHKRKKPLCEKCQAINKPK